MPGLFVHRSNRLEVLVDGLADELARPLLAPFELEQVLIQSAGMERYLTRELAQRMGVLAGLEFPFPRSFFEGLFARVLEDSVPAEAYVRKELSLHIYRRLLQPEDLGESLRSYLSGLEGEQVLALATQLAQLLDQYVVYRPQWVEGLNSAQRQPLEGEGFQAEFFGQLLSALGPYHFGARAQSFINLLRNSATSPLSLALPRRILLFGGPGLPPLFLQLFAELAAHLEVHLYFCAPTESSLVALPQVGGTALGELHPLLSQLGATGREFEAELEKYPYLEREHLFREPATQTLLGSLQRDLLGGQLQAAALPVETLGDGSVRVVSCCGALRELEVLKEWLLQRFAADADLRPEEVVVLLPQLEQYAPLVRAVFGSPPDDRRESLVAQLDALSSPESLGKAESGRPEHGADLTALQQARQAHRYLPYRVAEALPSAESTIADGFFRVLEVAKGSVSAEEFLSIWEHPAFERRFGLGVEAGQKLRDWLAAAGVRFGLNDHHLELLGVEMAQAFHLQAGLNRLRLGFALHDGAELSFRDIFPVSGLSPSDLHLLALAEELGDLLWTLRQQLYSGPGVTVAEFVGLGQRVLSQLFFPPDSDERPPAIWRALEEMLAISQRAGLSSLADTQALGGCTTSPLSSEEGIPSALPLSSNKAPLKLSGAALLAWLVKHSVVESSSTEFLAGGINFCDLLPLRNIPFKLICILGLGESEFPRQDPASSFDLLLKHPQPGDRSRRRDDRYLFLELMGASRQALYLSYVGRDPNSGAKLPPSLLVEELGEVLVQMTRAEPGARLKIWEHPLLPYSPRAYSPDHPELGSSSREHFHAALQLAARQQTLSAPGLLSRWRQVSAPQFQLRSLAQLAAWLSSPASEWLRQLGLRSSDELELIDAHEPLLLDPLVMARLRKELLGAALQGERIGRNELLQRAQIPPGSLGELVEEQLSLRVDTWLEALCSELRDRSWIRHQTSLALPGRPPLSLELEYEVLAEPGSSQESGIFHLEISRTELERKLLRVYLQHLTAQALLWREPREGTLLYPAQQGLERLSLPALSPEQAWEELQGLLDLVQEFMKKPVAFLLKTSLELFRPRGRGKVKVSRFQLLSELRPEERERERRSLQESLRPEQNSSFSVVEPSELDLVEAFGPDDPYQLAEPSELLDHRLFTLAQGPFRRWFELRQTAEKWSPSGSEA